MNDLPSFLTCSDPASLYIGRNFVALDFETDEINKGSPLLDSNDIVLASWSVHHNDRLVKKKHIFGGVYDMSELLEDVQNADFLLAMNAKFELGWLKRCGLELRDILVYDPMLAQWVLDGNRKGKGHERSLAALAVRYNTTRKLDLVGKFLDLGISMRDINERWVKEYCDGDVATLVEIFFKQREVVTERNVWHLVHTRHLTCAALADIEFNGLELNPEKVQEAYVQSKTRLAELEAELAHMTGGINVGSPVQLAVYLYDTLKFPEPVDHRGKKIRTDKGQRSTKAEYVNAFEAETEEQEKFLALFKEYNRYESLMSKNLEFFKRICDEKGGKFRGYIKQNATQTHRLASTGMEYKFEESRRRIKKTGEEVIKWKKMSCQVQNIPRDYKHLFWASDPDYVICSYDSSQIEFRMAVDMGKDKVGYEEIVTGTDIHQFTSQVLYENGDPEIVGIDDVKERRQQSKKHTFRPLFGGGSGSEALVAYCDYFKNKYVGVTTMQQGWAERCADKKEYKTPYGMTFYFPAEIQRSGYITHSTNIYNYPIQGISTGEIMPLALVYFWHRTRHLRCDIFVTIHDSVDARVHKDDVKEVNEIAIQSLTLDVYKHLRTVYNYSIRVPLGLGMKADRHWGEGKEYKLDVLLDGTRVER